MYICIYTVQHLCDNCCDGKNKLPSYCWATYHCQQCKIVKCCHANTKKVPFSLLSSYKMVILLSTEIYLGLYTKCLTCSSKFNQCGFSSQIFIKISNTKFDANLSSGSQADTFGKTDVMKSTVTFCNLRNHT